MGALPKRKLSKARRGKRRSHLALKAPQMDYCPQCHNPKLPHHACRTCGTYAGREVIKVSGPPAKPE
ncbi:MAG: 50S ribosomal protein L32 [Dehalococcoidales bacterium]|nr:50S ribosomal protein L32 [Dehalococcoidales bacterium]